jgi:hypothetical protein
MLDSGIGMIEIYSKGSNDAAQPDSIKAQQTACRFIFATMQAGS